LDIAASEFGRHGSYTLGLDKHVYTSEEWLSVLVRWINTYPIISIEDPFAEDDTPGMQAFTHAVGERIQVIGDDYLVTSAALIEAAARDKACNAVLLKPNQVGTLSETRQAMLSAQAAGMRMVVSARSGETEDTAIVHLATGWNTGQLKVGSFARSERMAKWNEGLRIEGSAEFSGRFAGTSGFPNKR
jgi:enolase